MLSISVQNKIPTIMKKQSNKLYDACRQYLDNLWQWSNNADQTVVTMLQADILDKFAIEACLKLNVGYDDVKPLYDRCKLFGSDVFEKLYLKWLTTEKHPVKPRPASGKGYDKEASDTCATFISQFKQLVLTIPRKLLAKTQHKFLKSYFDEVDWNVSNPYWECWDRVEINGLTISAPYARSLCRYFCRYVSGFEDGKIPAEIIANLQAKGIISGAPYKAPHEILQHLFGTPHAELVTLRQFNQFAKFLRTRAHIKHNPVVRDHAKARNVKSTFRRSGAHIFF